jgi:hypothetical protein
MMKREYLTSELIRAKLDIIKQNQTQISEKDDGYNLIILKTNNGNITIRTKLTADQWVKENQFRKKNVRPKKKKRK